MRSPAIATTLVVAAAGFSVGAAQAAGCVKGASLAASPVVTRRIMVCSGPEPAA